MKNQRDTSADSSRRAFLQSVFSGTVLIATATLSGCGSGSPQSDSGSPALPTPSPAIPVGLTATPTPAPTLTPEPTPTPTVSGVSIDPAQTALNPNGTVRLSAFVVAVNGANPNVSWTVEGGDANGTITPDGVYTAPTAFGTYRIFATSIFDSSKQATALITVQSTGIAVGVEFPASTGVAVIVQ